MKIATIYLEDSQIPAPSSAVCVSVGTFHPLKNDASITKIIAGKIWRIPGNKRNLEATPSILFTGFHQDAIWKKKALKMANSWNFWTMENWLVVSTHLKNISQIGPFPQIGMKIKHVWNHQPAGISGPLNKSANFARRFLVLPVSLTSPTFRSHGATPLAGPYP